MKDRPGAEAQDSHSTPKKVRKPRPRSQKPNTQNIDVNDMQATIEAHRASNLAVKIRNVYAHADGNNSDFMRLVLPGARRHLLGRRRKKLAPSVAQRPCTPKPPLQQSSLSTDETSGDHVEAFTDVATSLQHSTNEQSEAQDVSSPTSDSPPKKSLEYEGRSISIRGQWSFLTTQHNSWRCVRLKEPKRGSPDQQDFEVQRDKNIKDHPYTLPWMSDLQYKEVDVMLRLEEEIKTFESYMKLTPMEVASTLEAIGFVKAIVAAAAPSNDLSIHGSRYTGLASPMSDIDFSVALPEYEKRPLARGPSASRPESIRAGKKLLLVIMKALKQSKRYNQVRYIHARVDIVTAYDIKTGLSLQFSTLVSFRPAREYSMCYLAEFQGLRPLYVALRHFLLMRNLTGVRTGGIGSYPLLVMIVTALKHGPPMLTKGDLGHQLLHVLEFWSTADLYKYGYCADPPSRFEKKPPKISKEEREERKADPYLNGIDFLREKKDNAPFLLCLQDPANPTNDLGRNVMEIKHIQASFGKALSNLEKSIGLWEKVIDTKEAEISSSYTLLGVMLSGNYTDFECQREKLAKGAAMPRMVAIPGSERRDIKASEISGLYGKVPLQ